MANRVNDHLERSKQYLKKVDWNLLYKLLVSNVVAGDYVSTELIDFGSRVLAEKEIKEGTLFKGICSICVEGGAAPENEYKRNLNTASYIQPLLINSPTATNINRNTVGHFILLVIVRFNNTSQVYVIDPLESKIDKKILQGIKRQCLRLGCDIEIDKIEFVKAGRQESGWECGYYCLWAIKTLLNENLNFDILDNFKFESLSEIIKGLQVIAQESFIPVEDDINNIDGNGDDENEDDEDEIEILSTTVDDLKSTDDDKLKCLEFFGLFTYSVDMKVLSSVLLDIFGVITYTFLFDNNSKLDGKNSFENFREGQMKKQFVHQVFLLQYIFYEQFIEAINKSSISLLSIYRIKIRRKMKGIKTGKYLKNSKVNRDGSTNKEKEIVIGSLDADVKAEAGNSDVANPEEKNSCDDDDDDDDDDDAGGDGDGGEKNGILDSTQLLSITDLSVSIMMDCYDEFISSKGDATTSNTNLNSLCKVAISEIEANKVTSILACYHTYKTDVDIIICSEVAMYQEIFILAIASVKVIVIPLSITVGIEISNFYQNDVLKVEDLGINLGYLCHCWTLNGFILDPNDATIFVSSGVNLDNCNISKVVTYGGMCPEFITGIRKKKFQRDNKTHSMPFSITNSSLSNYLVQKEEMPNHIFIIIGTRPVLEMLVDLKKKGEEKKDEMKYDKLTSINVLLPNVGSDDGGFGISDDFFGPIITAMKCVGRVYFKSNIEFKKTTLKYGGAEDTRIILSMKRTRRIEKVNKYRLASMEPIDTNGVKRQYIQQVVDGVEMKSSFPIDINPFKNGKNGGHSTTLKALADIFTFINLGENERVIDVGFGDGTVLTLSTYFCNLCSVGIGIGCSSLEGSDIYVALAQFQKKSHISLHCDDNFPSREIYVLHGKRLIRGSDENNIDSSQASDENNIDNLQVLSPSMNLRSPSPKSEDDLHKNKKLKTNSIDRNDDKYHTPSSSSSSSATNL